jgi:hypothetical protein
MLRRAIVVSALGAAALAFFAVPAGATVTGRDTFSDSGSEVIDDFCGLTVQHDFAFTDRFQARVGKGDLATAFFGHDNYDYLDVLTNPETGLSMSFSGHGIVNDVKATHVSGSIFKFTTKDSGQQFVVRDDSGRVVLRDRGRIRETYLFDTEGDNEIGGIFLESLSLSVAGPHPGSEQSEDEFCAMVHDLIG